MKGATVSKVRPGHRLPGRTWLLRAVTALLLAGAVELLGAGPAAAHAVGGGAGASNYRTVVQGISPAIPGVQVRVVNGGNQLELVNRGAQEVTVLGYQNEPYLRVGPGGVFENERSPSTFSNRSTAAPQQIPEGYNASAEPQWRRISSQPVAVFHDHRAHWSGQATPAAVKQDPGKRQLVTPTWQVPIKVGDKTSILSGSIEWLPGPSPWPWAAVVVALAALVLLVSRSGWQAKALAGVITLAVVTDAVHTVGVWTGSTLPVLTQLYGSATSFAGWVVAAFAVHRLLTGRLEAGRTFMLLAAIFLALAGAAPDVPALARSQVPSGLDPTLTRAAISATRSMRATRPRVASRGMAPARASVAGARRRQPVKTPAPAKGPAKAPAPTKGLAKTPAKAPAKAQGTGGARERTRQRAAGAPSGRSRNKKRSK